MTKKAFYEMIVGKKAQMIDSNCVKTFNNGKQETTNFATTTSAALVKFAKSGRLIFDRNGRNSYLDFNGKYLSIDEDKKQFSIVESGEILGNPEYKYVSTWTYVWMED